MDPNDPDALSPYFHCSGCGYRWLMKHDRDRCEQSHRQDEEIMEMSEPTPSELVEQLHIAVRGDSWARPEAPADVWANLLDEVRCLVAQNERLREAIDKHRRRKHNYALVHLGEPLKYGCRDVDERLWSVPGDR